MKKTANKGGKQQIPTHFIMYILYIVGILKIIFDTAHKIWLMHPGQQSASIAQSPQTTVA